MNEIEFKLSDGTWDIGFTKQIDEWSVGYIDLCNGYQVDFKFKDNTLHSALLDLTIWAVKYGHLKPKEKQ